MKIVRLVGMGILAACWTVCVVGVTGGKSGSAQEIYKGPVGTEEHPVQVPAGVMAQSLILAPQPKYPSDAEPSSVPVVMTAKIDRNGRVVGLKVVSGPEMLRNAAMTAARQWRYHSYLLNGQPVFVQTTISVTFPKERRVF